MKGGDPDSPPPFKCPVFASIGGFGRGLTAKLALRLLGGVAVTKFQPMDNLAATSTTGKASVLVLDVVLLTRARFQR
jgi:hypothetical protein